MEIKFAGMYTPDELLRFDRAARKALGSSSMDANAGCYGFAAVVVLILGIVQWVRGNQSGALQWFACFAIAAALGIVQVWSTRRSFRRHPNANQSVSGILRDDGFEIQTPTSQSTILWTGIASATCDDDYLVLVSTTRSLYGFGRTFFKSREDFFAACQLVQSHVSNKPPENALRKTVMRSLLWIVLIVFIFLMWSLMRTR